MTFLERVRATIVRYAMFTPGETVVVGVSGGADSCALLLALHELRAQWELGLHTAHLNHLIRGASAEADGQFVASLAAQLGVPCTVESRDAPLMARRRRLSLEHAARVTRYQFFEELADRLGASKIAVGHTADDLLETMLLNLLRGAGVEGLAAMPPQRGRVVRPLMEATRAETQAFCGERGVAPRVDETNADTRHLRNRVRLHLVPPLKSLCPHILGNALRLTEVLRMENALLEALAKQALGDLAVEVDDASVTLDLGRLLQQPVALQRRVFRCAVERVRGSLEDVTLEHVELALSGARQKPQGAQDLPGGVEARWRGGRLRVGKRRKPPPPSGATWTLPVPGAVEIAELGLSLRASVESARDSAIGGQPAQLAHLDADKIVGNLTVRFPRPGDRFKPLGLGGTKKVCDFFADRKVPRHQRGRVPLVLCGEDVVWVVGYRVDDRFKVTGTTRNVIVLRVERGAWGNGNSQAREAGRE